MTSETASDLARCPRCDRPMAPEDLRIRDVGPTRDEPGYAEEGCRVCLPSPEDDEAARDAEIERRIDAQREGADW